MAGLALAFLAFGLFTAGLPARTEFERATLTTISLLPSNDRDLAVFLATTDSGRRVRVEARSLTAPAEGDRLCLVIRTALLTRHVSAAVAPTSACGNG